ncbi:DUF2254 domain-containing protein [Rhodococcus sp. BP-241]|uniref:DUF2254 domain-containing protein n=1 Tax=Rhodococcus sp. BP-241 TaxID=2739441 RepID=UPI001C9B3EB9|nr:DUF2254 domain-containing protein [Rhodococcus sp. BP-241]MBY6706298.1 DUF2254 domain-containing protein [Rhodococcus sp. BP-241]
MRRRWVRLQGTFWFVPAVLGVVAVVLAQLLVALDRWLLDRGIGIGGSLLYHVGASGSRDILGAIGGSMLGVAATSFSITISVLATASSTYGPRLVRNFMADRGNQVVLGIFGATFLYALMVLRSIRSLDSDGDVFVPDIAVNVAVLLAVLDVGVLVYFIHHIAQSIQVATLSSRVRDELSAAVDELYPTEPPPDAASDSEVTLPEHVDTVRAPRSGVVVDVDEDAALSSAVDADAVVVLLCRPGEHVIEGDAIAESRRWSGSSSASHLREIESAVEIGDERTPQHDIEFAVEQLAEMAVRALSSGTNDPYTARNALDDLSVGMATLVGRPPPCGARTDDAGTVRIVLRRVPVVDLIDHALGAVRIYAMASPMVVAAGIRMAERLGAAATATASIDRVRYHLDLLDEACRREMTDPAGRASCLDQIDRARGRLLTVAVSGSPSGTVES